MAPVIDIRRILIFLAFACGIAWGSALVVYLTGGLTGSPVIEPTTGLTLAFVLVAGPYMFAPAIASLLTRLITREGFREPYLRLNFRRAWPYWLAAWFGPGLMTVAGGAVFFLLFPAYFDPTLGTLREMIEQSAQASGQVVPLSVEAIALLQAVQGILIAPLINSLFTFGEELGWRAYLQPRLMPLGPRRALLLMGAIWGLWHWPVIAMGHNYGLDYPGAPWTGVLMMCWFTLVVGIFLGWTALRSQSVWPAVIGHAALNGIAGLAIFFAQDKPNPLLGPMPVGIIGSAGFALVALLILLTPRALAAPAGMAAGTSVPADPAS
ncbi:MAG: CPBP family intramembrane metalloprotease [Anaerolineae bacterium]|nr:CPBP family intramembrane metalloprotease [Anaerolineae bacterium]